MERDRNYLVSPAEGATPFDRSQLGPRPSGRTGKEDFGSRPENADLLTSRIFGRHHEFLRFVLVRIGDREEAEDLLQAAYLKALESVGTVRARDATVAWFYQVIRNSIVDHYRRRDCEKRALDLLRSEPEASAELQPSPAEERPCRCLREGLNRLKPEYRELLQRVDMGGQLIAQVAAELGITSNNTRVRLHRARRALRVKLEPCRTRCGGPSPAECRCAEVAA